MVNSLFAIHRNILGDMLASYELQNFTNQADHFAEDFHTGQ
jgi:hypothetical protein